MTATIFTGYIIVALVVSIYGLIGLVLTVMNVLSDEAIDIVHKSLNIMIVILWISFAITLLLGFTGVIK